MAIKKLSLLGLRRRRDRLNEGYFFFLAATFFFGAGFFALDLAAMMFFCFGFYSAAGIRVSPATLRVWCSPE